MATNHKIAQLKIIAKAIKLLSEIADAHMFQIALDNDFPLAAIHTNECSNISEFAVDHLLDEWQENPSARVPGAEIR
jgi:hypothetical protein